MWDSVISDKRDTRGVAFRLPPVILSQLTTGQHSTISWITFIVFLVALAFKTMTQGTKTRVGSSNIGSLIPHTVPHHTCLEGNLCTTASPSGTFISRSVMFTETRQREHGILTSHLLRCGIECDDVGDVSYTSGTNCGKSTLNENVRSLSLTVEKGSNNVTYQRNAEVFRTTRLFFIWDDRHLDHWEANVTFWTPNEYNNVHEMRISCQHTSQTSEVAFVAIQTCGGLVCLLMLLVRRNSVYRLTLSWLGLHVIARNKLDKLIWHILKLLWCGFFLAGLGLMQQVSFSMGVRTTVFIFYKCLLWYFVATCLRLPDCRARVNSWMLNLATIFVPLLSLVKDVTAWCVWAPGVWDDPTAMAIVTEPWLSAEKTRVYLNAAQIGLGFVIGVLLLALRRRDGKEVVFANDYSFERDSKLIRCFYWDFSWLLWKTFLVLNIAAIVINFNDDLWAEFFDLQFSLGYEGGSTLLVTNYVIVLAWVVISPIITQSNQSNALEAYETRGWSGFLQVRIKDVPYSSFSSYTSQSKGAARKRAITAAEDSGYKVQDGVEFDTQLARKLARLCALVYLDLTAESEGDQMKRTKCEPCLMDGRDTTTKINWLPHVKLGEFLMVGEASAGVFLKREPKFIEGTDARDLSVPSWQVIVAFRGTASVENAMSDLNSEQVPYVPPLPQHPDHHREDCHEDSADHLTCGGRVHQGFVRIFRETSEPVQKAVRSGVEQCKRHMQHDLLKRYMACQAKRIQAVLLGAPQDLFKFAWDSVNFRRLILSWRVNVLWSGMSGELIVTGHSMGGALALLTATEVALESHGTWCGPHLKCYTFGQPRVGNVQYAKLVDKVLPDYFRCKTEGDLVPEFPKQIAWGKCGPRMYCGRTKYKHAGTTVQLLLNGHIIFAPNYLEGKMIFRPQNHAMDKYEEALEAFHSKRRTWLWRKSIFIARLVTTIARQKTNQNGQPFRITMGSEDENMLKETTPDSEASQHSDLTEELKTPRSPIVDDDSKYWRRGLTKDWEEETLDEDNHTKFAELIELTTNPISPQFGDSERHAASIQEFDRRDLSPRKKPTTMTIDV